MRRVLVLVTVLGLMVTAVPLAGHAVAASSRILVFDGNGAYDEGYSGFGQAVGEPVDTALSLPATLSGYSCIVLPISGYYTGTSFSASDKAAFASYIGSGGNVVALGEWASWGSASISTLNDLASYLGADVSILADDIDNSWHVTSDITPSVYTAGVSSLAYGATSQVTVAVSGDAVGLARTSTASIFIAADPIGAGLFVLSGDSNVFSDSGPNPGYVNNDNGRLAANLCGGVSSPSALTCTPGNVLSTTRLVAGDTVSCTFSAGMGATFKSWSYNSFTSTYSIPQVFKASLAGPSAAGSITANYTAAGGSHSITYSYGIVPPAPPRLVLPWSRAEGPTTWYITSGPHCDSTTSACPAGAVRYALDFAPPGSGCSPAAGSGGTTAWVTAAAAGTVVYKDESTVEISHGRGFRTGYYHLAHGSIPAGIAVGSQVALGANLGHPSCDTSTKWGGSATGDHVHFYVCEQTDLTKPCGPLASNGMALPMSGLVVGGWTVAAVSGNRCGTLSMTGATTRSAPVSWCPPSLANNISSVQTSTYHPITPVRLLDTRAANNGHAGKLSANTPITFAITGRGGVPSGATALTGNVTVVNSSNGWAVYLGPAPVANPATSTINFSAGQVAGNGLTVALSASGTLSATFISSTGSTTDLVFDVTGYYTPDNSGQTYHPIAPVRELDTRSNNGLSGKLTANTPYCFAIAGRNGIPSGAKAVTGNVTVVNPTAAWAVYLGPLSTGSPTTAAVNFTAGQVAGNNTTVALSTSGQVCATYMGPAGAKTDLVFDVTGYYTADATGASFVPLTPYRTLDTRNPGSIGKIGAFVPKSFLVATLGGVPSGASGVAGNVTVFNETAGWAVFLGPASNSNPSTSTINFNVGDIKGNGLTVALSPAGSLYVTYMGPSGATADLVFDVSGYFVK